MKGRQGLLWVFIPMRDGRLKRHPEVYETFREAQEAFLRHTGVTWIDSFCAARRSVEGSYPGELSEGPARGSKIYPAVLRSPATLRESA
ncbi:MAG TPA: hypothetical protein VKU80_04190 [Planctomycetota bacterium]|nr:hypothetical protein [Planctomycetota bacterium]